MKAYDLIIVGSGPAGMFCAVEFISLKPDAKILIIEKGGPRKLGSKNLTSGWGGAGAFSDGKLTLSHEVGGQLTKKRLVAVSEFYDLMRYIQELYIRFGGNQEIEESPKEITESLRRKASEAGLRFIPYLVHHFGSDESPRIVENIYNFLISKGVKISLRNPVEEVIPEKEGYLVKSKKGSFLAKNVLIATGREGEKWAVQVADKLGLSSNPTGVDIGVRVELEYEDMREYTDHFHDLKLTYRSSTDDDVRTFCVCPRGFVVVEKYWEGLKTVNGHSFKDPNNWSRNTNFAILSTMEFTKELQDSVGYAKAILELARYVTGGKGIIIQRLFDIRKKRRSYWRRIRGSSVEPTLSGRYARPADFRTVIPPRQWDSIIEMIDRLQILVPALSRGEALLYGPEVKFYSKQIKVNRNFETDLPGIFFAGDGSGWTRGLLQSSMMGILVARRITSRG